MLIHAKISWYVGKMDRPEIKGYYDSAAHWNKIKVFYVDLWEIPKLIQYYKDNPDLGVSITLDRDTDVLTIHRRTKCQTVKAEKINFPDQLSALVWRLSFSDTHFNVDLIEDGRRFTIEDLLMAVEYGITVGIAAGFKGVRTIHGRTPKDAAIIYMNGIEGS